MYQKIIIICGPTCTGKTSTGIALAKEFNGELVSCDSQQVYKGLNIGTAKPSQAELSQVPHHLIDIVSPNEQFDVARFVELADTAIKDIARRGRIPFVVGGTGLYIKALCYGLAESPGRDEAYRAKLDAIIKNPPSPPFAKGGKAFIPPLCKGGKAFIPPLCKGGKGGISILYQMLQEKDPEAARTLKPNDSSRIIRALEVLHITGRSIRDFHGGHKFKDKRYDALKIGLNIERPDLYSRIEERVDRMIQDGLIEEALALVKKYGPDAPALKAVGYKEIVAECVAQDFSPANTGRAKDLRYISQIKQNTRRFAKRQLTWFRADKELKWFSPDDAAEIKKTVAEFLRIM